MRVRHGADEILAPPKTGPFLYMAAQPTVIAIIGDIMRSKQLPAEERANVQADLERLMVHVNSHHRRAVLADFLITLGDEFQGMLRDAAALPDIVQDVRERLPRVQFRIAVSRGQLTTPLKAVSLGMDGPVWHAARSLLDDWRRSRRDDVVGLVGFDEDDMILNGMAALLTFHWTHLELSQREILHALRASTESGRKELAHRLGISQQALSNRAQRAGWREFDAGMIAWRELLRRHPVSVPQ